MNIPQGTAPSTRRESSQSPVRTPESTSSFLLNEAPPSTEHTEEEQSQIQAQEQSPPGGDQPRTCWICFADETEDNPTTSAWRSPCPCALTAHESCLLDWVADLEAPSPRNRTGIPKKIECPQCKSKITIARPRSPVVEGVNAVERLTSNMTVPGICLTLAGSVLSGCWIHGLSTVYLVFGHKDANRLLGVDTGAGVSVKWVIGLPFIPIIIILSRTTIADNLLPILPIFFLTSQIPDTRSMKRGLWVPSAAMTVATLPYIRGAYNEIYKRLFAERERRWAREIQPRAGESGDNNNAGNQQERADGEGGDEDGAFLNFEMEIFGEIRQQPAHPAQGQPEQREPVQEQPAEGLPAQEDQEAGPAGVQDRPAEQQAPAPRQNNLTFSSNRIADTVFGALVFPAISSIMGNVLELVLPRAWTTIRPRKWNALHGNRQRAGILQTQWGRSIIGGCLFVVLKDTLLLYSRYRRAQDHKKRRVVDYDGKRVRSSG